MPKLLTSSAVCVCVCARARVCVRVCVHIPADGLEEDNAEVTDILSHELRERGLAVPNEVEDSRAIDVEAMLRCY
jgi:hypothetical protein